MKSFPHLQDHLCYQVIERVAVSRLKLVSVMEFISVMALDNKIKNYSKPANPAGFFVRNY